MLRSFGVVNSCLPEVNYSYSRVITGGDTFFSSSRLVITRSRLHGNVLGRFSHLWMCWTQVHEPKGTQHCYCTCLSSHQILATLHCIIIIRPIITCPGVFWVVFQPLQSRVSSVDGDYTRLPVARVKFTSFIVPQERRGLLRRWWRYELEFIDLTPTAYVITAWVV